MENTGLVFKMYTDLTNYSKGLKKAGGELNQFNNMMGNVGGMIAGAFTVGSIVAFGSQVISVTSEFQKFQAVLTNTLGSGDLAASYLKQISEFAAKTPFSVAQLTEAFVKLANQGFIPSQKEMTKLGDLASSTGKSFDQLAEAIIDATTGEFERLKEFGIKASANGDKVAFSFKGVTTEVDNTSASIRRYILGLGEAEGVTGAMAAISETLGGKVSNLGDSWDQFMLSIGNSEGPLTSVIDGITGKLNELTTVINDKSIPAWKRWLAGFNIGPYRKEILMASDAANNEAEQAAWRMEQLAVPAFDYQQIIEATTKSTKDLAKAALEAAKALETQRDMQLKLQNLQYEQSDMSNVGNVGYNLFEDIDKNKIEFPELMIEPLEIPVDIQKFSERLKEGLQETQNFVNQAGDLLGSFKEDIISTAAEGFGLMLTGDMGMAGFFNGILQLTADFAKQFGKLLISIGLAKVSLEKIGLSGIGAVVAGFALVAAASAMSSFLQNNGNMQGLATGTNYVPQEGPYYLHKGEAVVPEKYNPGAGNMMPGLVRVTGTISGRDIRLTQAREGYYNSRTTGR